MISFNLDLDLTGYIHLLCDDAGVIHPFFLLL